MKTVCLTCRINKSVEDFTRNSRIPSKVEGVCNDCYSFYNKRPNGLKNIYIYTLSSSDDPQRVLYVGKCINPVDRLYCHLQKIKHKRDNYAHVQLGLKYDSGNHFILRIIDECIDSEWERKEQDYIKLYKSFGAVLLNRTIGGKSMTSVRPKRMELNRPVAMLDPVTNAQIKEFSRMSDVAKHFNKPVKTAIKSLCRVLRGERDYYAGYKWQRL